MSDLEDDDDRPARFTIAGTDIFVIGMAALFSIGALYLVFGPSPMAPLMAQRAELARKEQQEAAQAEQDKQPAAPGEVNIFLHKGKPLAPPPPPPQP